MESINLRLRAASQIALLGAITKNLRAINLIQEGKVISVQLYYNKMDSEDEEIPEVFASEMISYFEDFEITANPIILPEPELIPEEGIRIFCRKE